MAMEMQIFAILDASLCSCDGFRWPHVLLDELHRINSSLLFSSLALREERADNVLRIKVNVMIDCLY